MNKEIIGELDKLPQTLLEKATLMLQNKYKIDEYNLILAKLNNETYSEVCKDKTFSNENKRKIEVNKRLDENAEYTVVHNDYTKLVKETRDEQLRIDFLNNRFKALQAMSRLMGCE